ncbi:hypothetical protein ACOSQ4_017330 [Xanthoceras sorbifolium]
MAKAYNRVEWCFVEAMFQRMRFPPSWIRTVMDCISLVQCSFLVNGESIGLVRPSRGLRLGDPLSLYLFLLCAEKLLRLISTAKNQGLFSSIRCNRSGPKITHLIFCG